LSRALYGGHILLDEVVKWLAYFEEVLDKASIEVSKPNETSDFFELRRWSPIFNSLYLDQIHRNFARADNQSKIVDMELFEFALLESKIEIVFFETVKNFVIAEIRLDTAEGSNWGSRQRGAKRLDALTHTAIAYAATSL
jgi:hypothetical protein